MATAIRPKYGPIQASSVANQVAARLRTQGVYVYSDAIAEIGTFVADNWGYITMPIGAYTYRLWNISLIAATTIAGKSDLRGNENVVKTANITDYIDTIIIEINGQNKWEMKASELAALNDYMNLATTEGELRIPFGSPNMHNQDMVEDAYQLGTGGLRSVKLRIKTKPAWVTGMRLSVGAEYAPVVRPIGYFQSTTRYAYTAPGIGNFSITDLAVGLDFASIWVQAASVQDVSFTIDRMVVVDATVWKLRSLHEAWGKDVAALGNGFMIDNFRDGDGVGYDSVSDQAIERKRGADVRLDLNMLAAGVPMQVIVFHCGLFSQQ